MYMIPNTVLTQFASVLKKNGIVGERITDYKKWLRYYLDFCEKYPVPDAKSERVRQFCEKLRKKKQTEQHSSRPRMPFHFTSKCSGRKDSQALKYFHPQER